MIEGEDDADDDDDDIRRLRARPTSARGGEGLQQQHQTKGQVLEGARRTRAGGAGRGGQTRAGSHYKEGTRSYSPVPAIHDFAGFPPPRPPFPCNFYSSPLPVNSFTHPAKRRFPVTYRTSGLCFFFFFFNFVMNLKWRSSIR
jgi:hypothetical protein